MLLFIIWIPLNVLIFEKKICKIDEEATGKQKYVSLVVSLLENKKKKHQSNQKSPFFKDNLAQHSF